MKGLTVFIVDDEPLMRLSMLDALEGIGCEVTAAATGTEGLVILGTRQFDIVITDLRLPGADGLTILKACKERSPTTEVILITAHGSVDTAVGIDQTGCIRLYYQTVSDGRVAPDRRARRENSRAAT